MSRFDIELKRPEGTDKNAIIGYDKPLRTFFLQGFVAEDDDFDEPEIWLGAFLEEFPTLESLVEEARNKGCEIVGLKHAAIISMLEEAGQKAEPSIGERLGLIISKDHDAL
jgi:hypothetical protein